LKFNPPFTDKKWQHNPHLLLNSLGFGQCDDYSSLLVQLWEELGFEARVFALEGHVVSEVKIKGKWQMYDATYGVYYVNTENQIASVQDLATNSKLVQFPNNIIPFDEEIDFYSQFARYNLETTKKYASQINNRISTWETADIPEITSLIKLPAKSSLSLPLLYTPNQFAILHNSVSSQESFIQAIKVYVPKNRIGKTKLPFVVASITGSGVLQLNGKKVNVKDVQPELFESIRNTDITILENDSGITIHYFINPSVFKLKENNRLIIEAENIENIEFETLNKSDTSENFKNYANCFETNQLDYKYQNRPFINLDVAKRNYNHFTQEKKKWQDHLVQMRTIEDLNNLISIYYATQGDLPQEVQELNTSAMNRNISYLIDIKPENRGLILEICKKSDLMYFVNIMESNPIEEVAHYLEILKPHVELNQQDERF
jgi:hypothetical protein